MYNKTIHIQLTGAVSVQVYIAGNNKSNKINSLPLYYHGNFQVIHIVLKNKPAKLLFNLGLAGLSISINRERSIQSVGLHPTWARLDVPVIKTQRSSSKRDLKFISNYCIFIKKSMMTKERLIQVINKMPEEFSIEDVIEELVFLSKIEHGLNDVESGRVYPDSIVAEKMEKWLK
jgi:hypothetical protein